MVGSLELPSCFYELQPDDLGRARLRGFPSMARRVLLIAGSIRRARCEANLNFTFGRELGPPYS